MKIQGLIKKIGCLVLSASMMCMASVSFSYAADDIAHDPSRDVQTEGVGNPFNYGERNTPADASTSEIRAINRAMSVQEVKYAMYKEIDEHWDLISVRLGQTEREMVYALFLGLGTRESTLGGNGDGADIETAFSQGFGVSSAHAYGTMQTAVTAFADCDPTFMKEDNVPEMYQYSFTESNFYDAIISNHMGIRKILHFIEIAINEDKLEGYQIVRGALKAFNTGWVTYTGENDGYYKNYPDEIISLARWYYEEGHLYDNVFSWTNDERVEKYRQGNVWEWWGDGVASMAPVDSQPTTSPEDENLLGDVNLDGAVDVADAVMLSASLLTEKELSAESAKNADIDLSHEIDCIDMLLMRKLII